MTRIVCVEKTEHFSIGATPVLVSLNKNPNKNTSWMIYTNFLSKTFIFQLCILPSEENIGYMKGIFGFVISPNLINRRLHGY